MFSALRAATRATPALSTSALNLSRPLVARALSTSAVARDISRLTLVGRVVGVSDARSTANGSEFVAYTVATNDPVVNKDQSPTSTFHRIYAFGDRTVERVNKLGKGDLVYVEADLRIERVFNEEAQQSSERVLTAHRTLFFSFPHCSPPNLG